MQPRLRHVPPKVVITPGSRLHGYPALPGAKYATVRAVLAAALAAGESHIDGVPHTDDTFVLLDALARLGIHITWMGPETIAVTGCAGRFPVTEPVEIDAGNAGAVLRLLLGVAATLPAVTFTTHHAESLGQRPNGDLLAALRQLGVEATARDADGRLPITLRRGALHGGAVTVSGARSSQYISALLFLAPLIGEDVTLTITDELRSASFIRLTIAMLAQAGITIQPDADLRRLHIPSPQQFQAREWHLPRDFPTAATWLAAGAVAGDEIRVSGLPRASEDGDAVLAALRAMGADITSLPASEPQQMTLLVRSSPLHGAQINAEPLIDSVPVLAAAACFAVGTTTFINASNLRLKESNRIDDLCAELNRAGATAVPGADSITITGKPAGVVGGVTVDAHHDHRLAMALAIVALRARAPLTITGAEHVAKSYPTFWAELEQLGAQVEYAND